MDLHEIQQVSMFLLAYLLFIGALPLPLEEAFNSLQRRIFPNFSGSGFRGRDVLTLIAYQPLLLILAKYRRDSRLFSTDSQ